MIKGRITREQTVWCWTGLNASEPRALRVLEKSRCQHWFSGCSPVTKEAKGKGWRVVEGYGWVCPRCVSHTLRGVGAL